MAFTPTATLKGFNRTFQLSKACKPYTLRDNGFVETSGGNYQYKRALDTTNRDGLVLKVTVNKALDQIKISTVNTKGLNSVDVTQLDHNEMIIEKINFIFDGFVDRQVFEEI